MAEYIEREALLEKLHEVGGCGAEPDTWADGYDKAIDVAYGLVQRTPAADVVPVVRCKDCKYAKFMARCSKYMCGKYAGSLMFPNDFCSYGERRSGE